jgi:hypothetical protein
LEDASDLDLSGSDGETLNSKRKAHGGRRAGAGNYQDADLKELLRLTEEELPIGGNGWKRISSRFAQWATCHSRPPRDAKTLEMKFKMVCSMSLDRIVADESGVDTACENKEANW